MPSLLSPAEVEPLPVDLRRVALIGTVAWALALVVTVVLALTVGVAGKVVATCAAGVVLGFLGLAWVRRRGRRSGPAAD